MQQLLSTVCAIMAVLAAGMRIRPWGTRHDFRASCLLVDRPVEIQEVGQTVSVSIRPPLGGVRDAVAIRVQIEVVWHTCSLAQAYSVILMSVWISLPSKAEASSTLQNAHKRCRHREWDIWHHRRCPYLQDLPHCH